MGPVWDFDLSFRNSNYDYVNDPKYWRVKSGYWHNMLSIDSSTTEKLYSFWKENKHLFVNTLNSIDSLYTILYNAANNNFRRWNILQSTKYMYHPYAYTDYTKAIESLKIWITYRIKWLDSNI